MSLQRYSLESVGFEFVSQSESSKRCVQWRDLVDKSPTLLYEEGKPYVTLELEARIEGNCPLKFANGQALDFVEGKGAIKIFRFRVTPPSVAFVVSGPGFTDQLIFEALVSKPKEVGFFRFFEGAQTQFDLGYGQFKTNNKTVGAGIPKSVGVVPIMSGLITVPFPWYSKVQVGFSLSQNLTNLMKNDTLDFQISEFAVDARYLWRRARDMLSFVTEIRGRNWYQLSSTKIFVVRSSPGLGLGFDYDGWFGTSKWGYSVISRYGFRSAAGASSQGELRAGASVNYKISKKWALGLGYKWSHLGIDFSNSPSQGALGKLAEQSQMFNVSLLLLPSIGEAK